MLAFLRRRRLRGQDDHLISELDARLSRVEAQAAANTARLEMRGAGDSPDVPGELAEAAQGWGERSVLLHIGGEDVIAVLGDDEGDPLEMARAICGIVGGASPQGVAS